MILVDTPVWIDHLRSGVDELTDRLANQQVACHSIIICELALGSLRDRRVFLESLAGLPSAPVAAIDEVMAMVERRRLWARGIGVVDAHLLAATKLDPSLTLWTRDLRLLAVAEEFGVAHVER